MPQGRKEKKRKEKGSKRSVNPVTNQGFNLLLLTSFFKTDLIDGV